MSMRKDPSRSVGVVLVSYWQKSPPEPSPLLTPSIGWLLTQPFTCLLTYFLLALLLAYWLATGSATGTGEDAEAIDGTAYRYRSATEATGCAPGGSKTGYAPAHATVYAYDY